MNSSYKELFKNTGILAISNFASKILIFLLVPLYTSVLTTEEYGFYDITYTTMLLLLPILTVNISDGVMRFCLDKEYDPKNIINIGIKFWFISIIIISIFFILNIFFSYIELVKEYSLLLFIYYSSHFLYSILVQSAKGLNRVKEMGIAGVISSVIMVCLNILFLKVFYIGLKGFYIANIFSQIIPMIYLLLKLKIYKFIKLKVDRDLQKKMLLYSAPLIFTSIGWWVNNNIDKYIMIWIVGLSTNGLLSVAYKIPSAIGVVGGIFTQAWQISAIKVYGHDESSRFYKDTYVYINLILGIGVGLSILFNKFIAEIMFKNDFYDAWKLVPFLLISAGINQVSGYIGPILSANYKSNIMAKAAIYGMMVNIILNIVFGKILGASGIPIATAIASFVILFYRKSGIEDILKGKECNKVMIIWVITILITSFKIYIISLLYIISNITNNII